MTLKVTYNHRCAQLQLECVYHSIPRGRPKVKVEVGEEGEVQEGEGTGA